MHQIIKSDKYDASKMITYKDFCSLVKDNSTPLYNWLSTTIFWHETSEGHEFWEKIAIKLYQSYYD